MALTDWLQNDDKSPERSGWLLGVDAVFAFIVQALNITRLQAYTRNHKGIACGPSCRIIIINGEGIGGSVPAV
ncbi:MAG: hypothetical protein RL839_00710 [Gammaproteobacteria bacterium]